MARTSELKRRGVTEAELTRAVRSGDIIRPRQGVYALRDAPVETVHAAEHGGTIGCSAAGALHGLWILDVPPETHVWMGGAGTPRRNRDACRVHWDEGTVRVGVPAPIRNALLQMLDCAGEDAFFAALESALRKALLSARDMAWLARRLPLDQRWLLAFARADADSGLESLIRLRLHRIGITVRSQVVIEGVGEVDFVIGDSLIIEADGRENHAGSSARVKDLGRDAVASALGYETLRFTYAMVVHDWQTVEDAVRGAMMRLALC